MKLLLATENKGKVKELQALFGDKVTLLSPNQPPPKVEEDAHTYRENAWKKASAYQKLYGVPVLADDSGLEVDALNGEPGVHTALFAADQVWPERWRLLLDRVKPFPEETWTARFRCVLCYFDGKSEARYFEGVAEGRLVLPQGNEGFGYDPIFFSRDLKKTFGKATALEKDRYSHRALAARAFLAWIA